MGSLNIRIISPNGKMTRKKIRLGIMRVLTHHNVSAKCFQSRHQSSSDSFIHVSSIATAGCLDLFRKKLLNNEIVNLCAHKTMVGIYRVTDDRLATYIERGVDENTTTCEAKCLNLLPMFKESFDPLYLVRDTHYNNGNCLAAEAIFDLLRDLELFSESESIRN